MAECRLCQQDCKLCKSHIVPEFLYVPLYNTDNKMMAISGRGGKGWKPLQIGVWDYLLCADCEQHLNREYEQPFLTQWTPASRLPDRMPLGGAHSAVFDYPTFKLFHLSILFKASVSSKSTFQEVRLGSHENRIRTMLLAKDPGQVWEYPILAFAVLNARCEVERRIITCPIAARYEGHNVYGQIYDGAMWWISVSSHRNDMFCRAGLQSTGHMTLVANSWNDIGVMQDASNALNRPNF